MKTQYDIIREAIEAAKHVGRAEGFGAGLILGIIAGLLIAALI
jgi:hypothetical protein